VTDNLIKQLSSEQLLELVLQLQAENARRLLAQEDRGRDGVQRSGLRKKIASRDVHSFD
jgi:hypothetical protein